jgi:ligand-binding sensor domain-containing protein
MNRNCLYLLTLLLPYSSFSQEYSYTHYNTQDGLAGSTVYCITQDRDGFIWVGTETGVSRFDGTHFTTFTVADGLPDIEVLQIYGDSKGRVWMAPFNHSVCYYYKGRIHNRDNDSTLKKIHLEANIEGFAEDSEGNILMNEHRRLHILRPDQTVREYDSVGGQPVDDCVGIGSDRQTGFYIQVKTAIYHLDHGDFSLATSIIFPAAHPNYIAFGREKVVYREGLYGLKIYSFRTSKSQPLYFDGLRYQHNTFSLLGDSLFYENGTNGTTETNLRTGTVRNFLPDVDVARIFRDDEGNIWFITLGQGIFRLNSENVRLIPLYSKRSARCAVYCIQRIGNELMVGTNYNTVFRFQLPQLGRPEVASITPNEKAYALFFDKLPDGNYICATDNDITESSPTFKWIGWMDMAVKSALRKNDSELILAGAPGVLVYHIKKDRAIETIGREVFDTIWHERATAVFYRSDTFYIGTLSGLYIVGKDRHVTFAGSSIPFLANRISSIVESPDHTLWISSYDKNGVIGYRYGRQVATIGVRQGLSSDICRTLFLHDQVLWIGTDKGLNRVDLRTSGYAVTRYTTDDGLGSNIVNSIFVDSSTVYVGTPAGLNFFTDEKEIAREKCRLILLSVVNQKKERIADTGHLSIPYTDKRVRFEFAGISYRSARNLSYRYRLIGLDSNWVTTEQNFLEYQSLPAGNYQLQVMAFNKFGLTSQPVTTSFYVSEPFWQTRWFEVLMGLFFLFVTWSIAYLRIKMIRRRQQERDQLTKRMSEMEHKALQSQMNPHFIFNCLNSIQQYIFDKDVFAANKYITDFARLIRATLYNSNQVFIALADEIDYLLAYLSLEKLRFKEKMDYSVEVDPDINARGLFIPPMLVQPYVENSMRHGLRYKTDGKGVIRLAIRLEAARLVMIIEDNGIGRERAASYKTAEHIEYQSRGMMLTDERIRLFNAVHEQKIEAEVFDLRDDEGRATGTRVVLRFPLFDHKTQNETYDPNHSGRR